MKESATCSCDSLLTSLCAFFFCFKVASRAWHSGRQLLIVFAPALFITLTARILGLGLGLAYSNPVHANTWNYPLGDNTPSILC